MMAVGNNCSLIWPICKETEEVNRKAVVDNNTVLLLCLQSADLNKVKFTILHLSDNNINFYLYANTLARHGIKQKLILPEINIVIERVILKADWFEARGYHTITLG